LSAFHFIDRYFWAIMIAVTFFQAARIRSISRPYIEADPGLAAGYVSLIRAHLVWMNIPWVVMGIGSTIGGVPSAFCFFNPRDDNPYVFAWFLSLFVLWTVGICWVFFMDGAQTLASHPGVVDVHITRRWPGASREPIRSTGRIKLFCLLAVTGGVLGVVYMWNANMELCKLAF
jgi:hypothetical protein